LKLPSIFLSFGDGNVARGVGDASDEEPATDRGGQHSAAVPATRRSFAMSSTVTLTLAKGGKSVRIPAQRIAFSAYRCFRFDDGDEDRRCLAVLADHLQSLDGVAVYGSGELFRYLLKHQPRLRQHFQAVVVDELPSDTRRIEDLPVVTAARPGADVRHVLLCDVGAVHRMQMRSRLAADVAIVEPSVIAEVAPDAVPARGWIAMERNIYPIRVPEVRFAKDQDLILLDCPARNLALMPNGLGYVNNALKKTSIRFQTFDLDAIAYHRFHIHRLHDVGRTVVLPSGRELPADPWQAEHYDVWSNEEVIRYFLPVIEEAAAAIVEARPKILGLSLQQCNEAFSAELVKRVKAALPETVILVGGFSCYNADIGLRAFPMADYMCIGEAELTVGPLVEALARGERPANVPGVKSHRDTPEVPFIPAPMPHNLDQIEAPKYEWFDLDVYRNYNDYQLTPIIASRGCRWSRCTFCAERFYWRIRSAKNFVDELQWLVDQGCTLFMFNESDLNGMPEKVVEICDEIIRRRLNVKLTGQLRIHKKSDRAFFDKLRQAGFVALRFGVDAFSENTLRLQKKGYTTDMVSQNLKDCWEAGIYTEVNWVVGIPGETDADVEEGIQLILKNRNYIGRLANINPLILVNGSVYWIDPESHGIEFRSPREELYEQYPRALPADSWYSVDPYIDAQVRKERFEHIVVSLHDNGFPVGPWAQRIIDDVKLRRDASRVAGEQANPPPAAAETPEPSAEVAELLHELETHRVLRLRGAYYAVPRLLGEIADHEFDQAPGVIREESEEAVLEAVAAAHEFANSRGRYDVRERQRRKGSYLRVDSLLGEAEAGVVAPGARIVRFEGERFAVDPGVLDRAFAGGWVDAAEGGEGAKPPAWPGPVSPLRRVVGILPASVQQEMRRIWKRERLRQEVVTQPSPRTDLEIALAIGRGFVSDRLRAVLRGQPEVAGEPIDDTGIRVVNAVTKGAVPELMRVIGNYNVVQFDSRYYAMPHGLACDFEGGEARALPGVFEATSVKAVSDWICARLGAAAAALPDELPAAAAPGGSGPAGAVTRLPKMVKSLEGYNVVTYEGWVYGIPQELGDLNLTEVDVMEIPGVIRDVSQDVVENEILDRIRQREAVAGAA
jgi:radical SAM superfamily enzyme YgiQ (UPF0313 family)